MTDAASHQRNHSVRRLNHLAIELGATRYLEIGVETGSTFFEIDCMSKTAVDPKFLFDKSDEKVLNRFGHCQYFEMPSDQFFRERRNSFDPYDLVFIDGLHNFDQVMRDFVNSIKCAHSRTVYVIDDTFPCDVFSSLRDQRQALELRAQYSIGIQGNAWHGDVYLFVILLSLYFPEYRYRTFVGTNSNPQTVIWLDSEVSEVDEWTQVRSLWAAQNLASCGYSWLLENVDMLRPAEEKEGLDLVIDSLSVARA